MTHGKGRKFEKLPPITLDIVKSGQYVLSRTLGLFLISYEQPPASAL